MSKTKFTEADVIAPLVVRQKLALRSRLLKSTGWQHYVSDSLRNGPVFRAKGRVP